MQRPAGPAPSRNIHANVSTVLVVAVVQVIPPDLNPNARRGIVKVCNALLQSPLLLPKFCPEQQSCCECPGPERGRSCRSSRNGRQLPATQAVAVAASESTLGLLEANEGQSLRSLTLCRCCPHRWFCAVVMATELLEAAGRQRRVIFVSFNSWRGSDMRSLWVRAPALLA